MKNTNQTIVSKQEIIDEVIKQLSKELSLAINAANEAHLAAIDDQSVAETQYDTLAIEAGYLAEGQSRRAQEFQQAISAYEALAKVEHLALEEVQLTALIQLGEDVAKHHWYFIGPSAGGTRCHLNGQTITVITVQSPLAQALLGKQLDDDVEVILANHNIEDYIAVLN